MFKLTDHRQKYKSKCSIFTVKHKKRRKTMTPQAHKTGTQRTWWRQYNNKKKRKERTGTMTTTWKWVNIRFVEQISWEQVHVAITLCLNVSSVNINMIRMRHTVENPFKIVSIWARGCEHQLFISASSFSVLADITKWSVILI